VVDVELGLEGGAEQAGPAEAAEAGLFLGDLAGDEGHAEQLAVGVLEAGAGVVAVVDDGLRVADGAPPAVVLHPVSDGGHGDGDLLVVEVGPGGAVVGREHQDLVDAAGQGLGEDRPEVRDLHGLVTVEGGVAVGDDAHGPLPAAPVGLERRGGRLFVARAERAGLVGVGDGGLGA
jgi:hypothetical protein